MANSGHLWHNTAMTDKAGQPTFQSSFENRRWALGNALPDQALETVPVILDQLAMLEDEPDGSIGTGRYIDAMTSHGFTREDAVKAIQEHREIGAICLTQGWRIALPKPV